MSAEFQFAAFRGGQLRVLASQSKGREAVLALPLNRLIVKLAKVPPATDPVEFCTPLLQAESPFPDEPLTVGCETIRETEDGATVIAAAFPESAAEDVGEALDEAKLNVVAIDLLELGLLRGIWSALGESDARRMVLVRTEDCLSLLVLDGDQPSAVRAISNAADLRREVMLSLLEAEDFGGARALGEIVVVDCGGESAAPPPEALSAFAPVRTLAVGEDAGLVGVAERARDAGTLNALPASWREMLEESRFKRRMCRRLAAAAGLWLLAMGVLFGVPAGYDLLTGHQKSLSRQHSRRYREVKEMKAKVDLIHKYSDHARGALEIMKAISDRLPEGVTLNSWDYRRGDGLRVRGEGDTAEAVYRFKDAVDLLAAPDANGGEPVFGEIALTGPNLSKNKYAFNLDCHYGQPEEE